MEVSLYVYDLSQGLARVYSQPLTGIQIDAIYHTSVVFGGVEYFFGRGIHQTVPGTTHHGQPMQKINMGTTELPMEVITEYLQSLSEVYTQESYDLFLHNCNNFSHDLCLFLLGKGIPEHIKNLPQTFLNTPFGQMMKPHIDGALRGITQGPAGEVPASNGHVTSPRPTARGQEPAKPSAPRGKVHNVTTLSELEGLLSNASTSCAAIFFTSSTCPPCKMVYPAYDEMAAEFGDKVTLIKVDISSAYDIGSKYGVSATPTFMTFLKGKKENVWRGANESQLRGNVKLLVQMAWPVHPHTQLRLPSLQRKVNSYVIYKSTPPIDKLLDKLGPVKEDPVIGELAEFVKIRKDSAPAEATVPNLGKFHTLVNEKFHDIPEESLFALIDLVRIAFVDPRVCDCFAAEGGQETMLKLLSPVNNLDNCPYALRLVMLQLACNLFASPHYPGTIACENKLRETCVKLVTTCVQDANPKIRVIAAGLAFNLAACNHNERLAGKPDIFLEGTQISIAAVLMDGIQNETKCIESLHGMLLALGLLVYSAPMNGAIIDMCKAMDASGLVQEKQQIDALASEPLLKEVGQELLGKGLST